MSAVNPRQWRTITREERYFTSLLFHELCKDAGPLIKILRADLELPTDVEVLDEGFEVSFFRDAYRPDLIEQLKLRKLKPSELKLLQHQTYDLVLFLSSKEMVIIEAKAQQSFNSRQLRTLAEAKNQIEKSGFESAKRVYLVALYSSLYSPRPETLRAFDAHITWKQIAERYGKFREDFERADCIYGKGNCPENAKGSA